MYNALIVLAVLLLIHYIFNDWIYAKKQRWYAWFQEQITEPINKAMRNHKTDLFGQLKDIVSADPELRKNNKIRILEIGAGSGANFKFLPPGTQLVALDINDKFKQRLLSNLKCFPHLRLERYVLADAANMKEIASNSIDAVVSQYCLCACHNVPGVLEEVRRVLVPGGSFYFLEHVVDKWWTLRRPFQQFIQVTGIWPYLACGCNVAKDTASYLRNASFSKLEMKEFYLETKHHWIFHFTKPTIGGKATK
ncbi:hypothetical protein B566_EDAN008880 [Ephemera danica]|nr:hypothetical protein B566_EDAN008880 [Ephemera danica]